MDTAENRENFTKLKYGFKVERAAADLPQSTDEALFSISGGRVIVTLLFGEVTTVIQTQSNNTKIVFNPTATGADQDLCAVLNISADAVGEHYSLSGTVGDALRSDLLIERGPTGGQVLLLSEGDIELNCAASNTGQVAWTIRYFPYDIGAVIEAA